jgi:replication fork protection complex subunit Tof1/Swi1
MSADHLLSIVSALGGFEECETEHGFQRAYVAGDEVVDCLRDLKKILRADDATFAKASFRQLGHWKVLQKDLIPLLLTDDRKIQSLVRKRFFLKYS